MSTLGETGQRFVLVLGTLCGAHTAPEVLHRTVFRCDPWLVLYARYKAFWGKSSLFLPFLFPFFVATPCSARVLLGPRGRRNGPANLTDERQTHSHVYTSII